MTAHKLTETIIAQCVPSLRVEIDKLNKKATKLGCAKIQLTVGPAYDRLVTASGGSLIENVADVVIEGEPITLNGWRFIARIERLPANDENLISTVPGEKAPDAYRKSSPYQCEHCNENRKRKFTWLVRHENGGYKQVGSSCLDDFLQAKSPEKAVWWWMTSLEGLERFLSTLHEVPPVKHGNKLVIDRGYNIPPMNILNFACAVVRIDGEYQFDSDNHDGTPSKVWKALFGSSTFNNYSELDVTAEDEKRASEIVAYIGAQPSNVDYFKNLQLVFSASHVNVQKLRFIVSSVYTYMKAHKLHRWQQRSAYKNEHVGAVGDRLRGLSLKVERLDEYLNALEEVTQRLIMRDADGRSFMWYKTSPHKVSVGDTLILDGTVKKHDEYKTIKQTVITRCFIKEPV